MSTTGPMTRATRPVPPALWVSGVSVTVAVMCVVPLRSVFRCSSDACGGERVGAADDLADLLGDLGLAGLVGQPGVEADEVLGVVRRRLHRALSGGLLAGRCL